MNPNDTLSPLDLKQPRCIEGRPGYGSQGFKAVRDLGFTDLRLRDLGFIDLGFGDLGFRDLGFRDLELKDSGLGFFLSNKERPVVISWFLACL